MSNIQVSYYVWLIYGKGGGLRYSKLNMYPELTLDLSPEATGVYREDCQNLKLGII